MATFVSPFPYWFARSGSGKFDFLFGTRRDRKEKEKKSTGNQGPKIRCPQCLWQPRAHSRWACTCGHLWNTFDTAGKCPACEHQWTDTACPKCKQWSRHEAWYEKAPDKPPDGPA